MLNKFKIFEHHRIQNFSSNIDSRKPVFLSAEKISERSCFVYKFWFWHFRVFTSFPYSMILSRCCYKSSFFSRGQMKCCWFYWELIFHHLPILSYLYTLTWRMIMKSLWSRSSGWQALTSEACTLISNGHATQPIFSLNYRKSIF